MIYPLGRRVTWAFLAIALGIIVAGLWNYKVVDGFGRTVVTANTIGDSAALSGAFGRLGAGFGIIFAAVAGLAATFTACNCVVYAMLPGLACSTDKVSSRKQALDVLLVFATGVIVVGALYGIYVGMLGPSGVQVLNKTRLPQAQITFTGLGIAMLIWGAISLGFLGSLLRVLPRRLSAFFARPLVQAGVMGVMVGLFAVGRPYPVFHDFLSYAAASQSPVYGALVMAVQGLGQIALMVVLFLALVTLLGDRLTRWVDASPHQPKLVSAMALFAGGAYFIFYWGLALSLGIGSWGFKLGLYQ